MATYTGTSADETIVPGSISGSVSHPILTGLLGGDDLLLGMGGDDTLDGAWGVDTMKGGSGSDTLWTYADDTAFGGTGNDIFELVIAAGAILKGGDGIDTVRVDFGQDLSDATYESVEILDVSNGYDFEASIRTLGHFETIDTGSGDPVEITLTFGGSAAFEVIGDERLTIRFSLEGGTLDMRGSTAEILVFGEAGDENLRGGDGLETMLGGEGDDTLDGVGHGLSLVGDSLDGGVGDDVITVHSYDTATGGDNDDRFELEGSLSILGGTVINGGLGHDQLLVHAAASLGGALVLDVEELLLGAGAVSLSAAQLSGFQEIGADGTAPGGAIEIISTGTVGTLEVHGLDTLTVERGVGVTSVSIDFIAAATDIDIEGGSGDDIIVTDGGDDTITGLGGSDILDGRGGDDLVILGNGGTPLALAGGDGEDVLQVSGEVDLTTPVASGLNPPPADVSGFEVLRLLGGATLTLTATQLAGFDIVEVGVLPWAAPSTLALARGGAPASLAVDGLGPLEVTGSDGADTLTLSAAGRITVAAGDGDDSIVAGDGADTIQGDGGDDTLSGRAGADLLAGGEGSDSLYGRQGGDTLLGGAGDDLVNGGAGTDTASFADASAGVTVSLVAAGPQDTGDGLDELVSIENLEGGAFADTLTGDDGANLLDGLGGDDTLTGGAGADTFRFAGTGAVSIDVITDFTDGEDKLSFVGFGFSNPADLIPWAGQAGADTVFVLFDMAGGVTQVTLAGFQYANLDVSDFGLVAA